MKFIFLLLGALVIQAAISYLIFWAVTKIFRVRLTARQLFVILICVTLVQLVFSLLSSVAGNNVLVLLLVLASVLTSLVVWHTVVNKCTESSKTRSSLSYMTASLLTTFATVIAALVALNFVQVFETEGSSMEPTYRDETRLLVYKNTNNITLETIVIHKSQAKNVIGRVKALPGQEVTITGSNPGRVRLEPNQYYVVPDNAKFVPSIVTKDEIIGKAGSTI